ncbi:MAG TPA: class I SAM-dependent methyltransferase [Actinokineospora sp.]|nr:class I SAM-dependent methyltransferase [Actinokineospora sp.]
MSNTVKSYEAYAETYNTLVSAEPTDRHAGVLRAFADLVPIAGSVLEIGSGPGRDADYLETLGVEVRRTDATQAFLDIQARRGKHGDLVNVITDELGGPYDGVLAECVLIHVGHAQIDAVLGKIAAALRPGGAFLVSVRDGDGETDGDYLMAYWRRPDFAARLAAAGFEITWDDHHIDCDGDAWLTFLTRRTR